MTISRATEPLFAIKNGVRSVSPYYFEYRTTFKERWRGQSAPHVLQNELGQTEAAVKWGVDSGHIYVTAGNGRSGNPVEISGDSVYSYKLSNHDIVHNLQHCHEPNVRVYSENQSPFYSDVVHGNIPDGNGTPKSIRNDEKNEKLLKEKSHIIKMIFGIMDRYSARASADTSQSSLDFFGFESFRNPPRKTQSHMGILHENDDIIIIDKPGGIPTHPGGIYRYNTISEMLARDLGYPVWPCHRLDKSTSGLIVFAKSKKSSSEHMKRLSAKDQVEKWYLARVKGKFSYAACQYTCPLISVNSSGAYINVANPSQVPTNSTTHFHLLSYSAKHDTSVVLCRPITGRMHQIRIHLRNLGHPIQNDDLYAGNSEMSAFKNSVELSIYKEIWNKFPAFKHPLHLAEVSHGAAEKDLFVKDHDPIPPTICISEFISNSIDSDMKKLSEMRSKIVSRAISGTCPECNRPLYLEKDGPGNGPDAGIWLHALALRWQDSAPNSFFAAAPLPAWCQ